MTTQHTPTPWKAALGFNHRQKRYDIEGPDHSNETATSAIALIVAQDLSQEDTAFIVRACNAHEELVEALKASLNFIDACVEDCWDIESNGSEYPKRIEAIISAAIAKAEGR